MGYDVQFIQADAPTTTSFPLPEKEAAVLLADAVPFDDAQAVRDRLLAIDGCKPGPDDAVDYMGAGLNYARFFARKDAIIVENNCNARELLRIYAKLLEHYPNLLIRDLQNGQLHDAESYAAWWSKPL